jgi:hypothetical protein
VQRELQSLGSVVAPGLLVAVCGPIRVSCVVPPPSRTPFRRGRIWGPHLLLSYWALSNPQYAHLASVNSARKALVQLSGDLLLQEWTLFRQVTENYNGVSVPAVWPCFVCMSCICDALHVGCLLCPGAPTGPPGPESQPTAPASFPFRCHWRGRGRGKR